MGSFSLNKFITGLVAIIIAVILLVSLAVPIISKNVVPDTVDNAATINSLLGIVPLLIAVAIILAVIYMFVTQKRD